MATVTGATEVSVMNIVEPVTINAAPVITDKPVQRLVMAGMTMDFGVRVPEFEVRIIVIETPDQPGIGVVAVGTTLSEATFMHIIGAMAVDTFVAGITKDGGGMAGFTTDCGMLADEREAAQIMVESNFFLPGNFIVTLPTLGALLFLMNIVLFVTAVTGGINFLCFSANRMTCLADQIFMRAVEREIGVCVVVKFCVLPSSDDMTVLAFFTVQLVMNIIGTMAAVTITWFFI